MEWLSEYYLKPAVQAFIKEKRIHNAKFWEMKYLRKCFEHFGYKIVEKRYWA